MKSLTLNEMEAVEGGIAPAVIAAAAGELICGGLLAIGICGIAFGIYYTVA